MLLNISFYVALLVMIAWTVWPTFAAHPFSSHRAAFYKTFFLWLISSLPVLITIALARPANTDSISKISTIAGSPFSPSEQFVYATSFIAPALFVFIDAFNTLMRDSDQDRIRKFRTTLRHYHRILWPSGLILVISVLLFVGLKTTFLEFDNTNIYRVLHDKAIFIYLVSILYWYCVNLIDAPTDTDLWVKSSRETDDFVKRMAGRLREKKNG